MPRLLTLLLAFALTAAPALVRAQSVPASPAPTAAPTADPAHVQELALDVFHQLQNGNLDRSLFTDAASTALTDDMVRTLGQQLGAVGEPSVSFLSVRSADGGITVYTYLLRTPGSGNLDYVIALDSNGKIAGINFSVDHSHG